MAQILENYKKGSAIKLDIITLLDYNSHKGRVIYAVNNPPQYLNGIVLIKHIVKKIELVNTKDGVSEVEIHFESGIVCNFHADVKDLEYYLDSEDTENYFEFSYDSREDLQPRIL